MLTSNTDEAVRSLEVTKDVVVAAPAEVVFAALLDQMGPMSEMPDGTPFPMKIEPWPGGRWFRDLGGNTGHFWGHVQVIKPPSLLEICGPLFMSYPAVNFVQYRLTAEGGGTRLRVPSLDRGCSCSGRTWPERFFPAHLLYLPPTWTCSAPASPRYTPSRGFG